FATTTPFLFVCRFHKDPDSVAASRSRSQRAAVVRPVQQGLALFPPALQVAAGAVVAHGRGVARGRAPAADLAPVVRRAAPHVVTAIPLEPAARILWMDPSLAPPRGERLRRVDA